MKEEETVLTWEKKTGDCVEKGDFGEAIASLRRAFEIDPNNAAIGYHLGIAQVKAKNRKGARKVLEHALKHVGKDADLKAKIEKVLQLVGD